MPCEGQKEVLHGYIGLLVLVKLGEAVKYSKSWGKESRHNAASQTQLKWEGAFEGQEQITQEHTQSGTYPAQ